MKDSVKVQEQQHSHTSPNNVNTLAAAIGCTQPFRLFSKSKNNIYPRQLSNKNHPAQRKTAI
jgi:hypothetical protein